MTFFTFYHWASIMPLLCQIMYNNGIIKELQLFINKLFFMNKLFNIKNNINCIIDFIVKQTVKPFAKIWINKFLNTQTRIGNVKYIVGACVFIYNWCFNA